MSERLEYKYVDWFVSVKTWESYTLWKIRFSVISKSLSNFCFTLDDSFLVYTKSHLIRKISIKKFQFSVSQKNDV